MMRPRLPSCSLGTPAMLERVGCAPLSPKLCSVERRVVRERLAAGRFCEGELGGRDEALGSDRDRGRHDVVGDPAMEAGGWAYGKGRSGLYHG
jgi:hypothetical protein